MRIAIPVGVECSRGRIIRAHSDNMRPSPFIDGTMCGLYKRTGSLRFVRNRDDPFGYGESLHIRAKNFSGLFQQTARSQTVVIASLTGMEMRRERTIPPYFIV